jgi:hypothetical protein
MENYRKPEKPEISEMLNFSFHGNLKKLGSAEILSLNHPDLHDQKKVMIE